MWGDERNILNWESTLLWLRRNGRVDCRQAFCSQHHHNTVDCSVLQRWWLLTLSAPGLMISPLSACLSLPGPARPRQANVLLWEHSAAVCSLARPGLWLCWSDRGDSRDSRDSVVTVEIWDLRVLTAHHRDLEQQPRPVQSLSACSAGQARTCGHQDTRSSVRHREGERDC